MKLKLLFISLFFVPTLSFSLSCTLENFKKSIVRFKHERLQNLLEICRFDVNGYFPYEFNTYYPGYSPLSLSVRLNNIEAVKLLLKQDGIDVNLMNETRFGERPLTEATDRNLVEIVTLLLQRKDIDINAKDRLRRAPLIFVAQRGNIDLLNLFFERRDELDVNTIDYHSRTPLQWAVDRGYEDIFDKLFEDNKTFLNNRDIYGHNVLGIAAFRENLSILKKLTNVPEIDINNQGVYSQTALIRAVYNGSSKNVKILLKRKDIDLSLQEINGLTAYKVSREKKHWKISAMILRKLIFRF